MTEGRLDVDVTLAQPGPDLVHHAEPDRLVAARNPDDHTDAQRYRHRAGERSTGLTQPVPDSELRPVLHRRFLPIRFGRRIGRP